MKNGMAALAQDDQACLNGIGAMENLFRRMAHDHIGFEFDLLFLGACADRDETLLKPLPPVFENRVELRALGRFGRTDHSQNE